MAGRTDFTTDARWEDVRTIWYTLVDDAYQTLAQHYGAWRRTGPQPLFSDSEASTVGLISDTWFAGHEALRLSFLRQYHPTLFPHLPPDGWFNQRRTVLAVLIDQVRRVITWHSGLMAASDPVRLLDSAPITLAKDTRGGDNRTLNGSEYFGVASSKGAKLFGLRLHVTMPMGAVFEQVYDLLVLGDGAFHSPALAPVLREKHRVEVLASPCRDRRTRAPYSKAKRRFLGRVQRKIETAFSVLLTVFHHEQPNARSLRGVICRISTRLLAYNFCFVTGSLLVQLGAEPAPN
jgi:hypothetical protein